MEFVCGLPIRFADIDQAGIVYAPQILHYYHCAFEEFFGATHGTPYWQWLKQRKVGFPTVRVAAEYEIPLRYGDPLDIAVSVARISTRSVDFAFEARCEGQRRAWSVDTKVCVDMDSLTSISIPDDLVEVLREYSSASA